MKMGNKRGRQRKKKGGKEKKNEKSKQRERKGKKQEQKRKEKGERKGKGKLVMNGLTDKTQIAKSVTIFLIEAALHLT